MIANNLGDAYSTRGRYIDAEALQRRAIAIREKVLGPNHPDVAFRVNNLASVYVKQRKYPEAEVELKRARAICRFWLRIQSHQVRKLIFTSSPLSGVLIARAHRV